MGQLGNVAEIQDFKRKLDEFKEQGIITAWELPYEHLLTRLSAAIFFVCFPDNGKKAVMLEKLSCCKDLQCCKNDKIKLSQLDYRIDFNKCTSDS